MEYPTLDMSNFWQRRLIAQTYKREYLSKGSISKMLYLNLFNEAENYLDNDIKPYRISDYSRQFIRYIDFDYIKEKRRALSSAAEEDSKTIPNSLFGDDDFIVTVYDNNGGLPGPNVLWTTTLAAGTYTPGWNTIPSGVIIDQTFHIGISSSGAIDAFTEFIVGLKISPTMVLLLIIGLYIMVGCMVDPVSMLIITLPAVMPVAEAIGFHPIWFGIIVITMLEVGVITPPVGMNAYTVKAVAGSSVTTGEIFSGVSFFLMLQAIVLTIIIAFPIVVTYLPSLMD